MRTASWRARRCNTLDRPWFGQISWMSSMYVAACAPANRWRAKWATPLSRKRCARIADNGTKNITARLYNGEYFFNIIDPKHIDTRELRRRQPHRPGLRPELGLSDRPAAHPAGKGNPLRAQSLWKYNFSPECRRLFHRAQARSAVCQCGRCRHDHVHVSRAPIGITPRPPAAIRATSGFAYYFNRDLDGQRIPSGQPYVLGRHAARRHGHRPGHP